jgi:hypothetical protein
MYYGYVRLIKGKPGAGARIKRAVEGWNQYDSYNLAHCKNFCKCHNVPPPSTTIKEKNKNKVKKKRQTG